MAIETTVKVVGMSCGHCVGAVTEELSAIDGVLGVGVDLDAGTAQLTSDGPIDPSSIAAAIDEAGFELAP